MKVLLDIDDKIALHFMAVLKTIPYIKAEQITNGKAKLIKEIKESFDEIKEIKAGKKKAKSVRDFLNEL